MTSKAKYVPLACLALLLLTSLGTSHALAAKKWTVDFRLVQWKHTHVNNAKVANQRAKTLKSLGCEVQVKPHSGHIDVIYRQAKWRTLSFNTDEEAHKWQNWLKSLGFETRHEH